jgi:hypothetical protein
VFARPAVPRSTPIQRVVGAVSRKTARGWRSGALPQRPVPYVPIIRNPTPRQTRAAKHDHHARDHAGGRAVRVGP